jgi:hypothetical protein
MGPLIPNDWTLLRPWAPLAGDGGVKPEDLARIPRDTNTLEESERERPPAWHGTILPAADGDTWLSAAFADYQQIVALEQAIRAHPKESPLFSSEQERLEVALFQPAARYLGAVARRRGKDLALSEVRADLRSDEWYDISAGKGVLILAELRKLMGDRSFLRFMDEFGRAHAGRKATTLEFFTAAEKAHGQSLGAMKDAWLGEAALSRLGKDTNTRMASACYWTVDAFERQLDAALIVYGTLAEAEAQQEAAGILQRKLAARWANITIPIKKDRDVSEDDLKSMHLVLIGRPGTNQVAAQFAKALPVRFGPASFQVKGQWYAHPRTALVVASPNPQARDRSVVLLSGLSAEGTWQAIRRFPNHGGATAEVILMEADRPLRQLALPLSASPSAPGAAAETSKSQGHTGQAPAPLSGSQERD